jgi:uncharacterized protein (TIGR03437 family)
MKVLTLSLLAAIAAYGLESAPGIRLNSFRGSDPAGWRTSFVPSRPAVSAASAAKIAWSTYIGDSRQVVLRSIAVDAAGNTYAVANRAFPEHGVNPLYYPPYDVLVVKLDPSGGLVYTTTLGGKGNDQGRAIAVDAAGSVWVGGSTTSPNFPLRHPIQPQPGTAFLAKLDANGALVFSTYLGGTGTDTFSDAVTALAVDAAGSVYFTGRTWSPNLPVTPEAFQKIGYANSGSSSFEVTGFVGKASPGGTLLYLTYLGGENTNCHGAVSSCVGSTGYDAPAAIAVDADGNAYIAGSSNKLNFPVTPGAAQASVGGPFVAKLNAAGSALIYSTGLGGLADTINQPDSATAIAVDGAGNAYVTGVTKSPTFPVTEGALQTNLSPTPGQSEPAFDGFVTKVNPTGTAFLYSTYLGGPGDDAVNAIVVDAAGDAYVTGESPALDLQFDPTLPSGLSFVAELNPAGSGIVYAARLPTGMAGDALALDAAGKLHLAGPPAIVSLLDPAAPVVPAILAVSNSGGAAISGRVAPGELVSLWGNGLGPAAPALGVVENGFFTKSAAGVQVFFDELPAPLLYVSDTQVNAVAPWAIAGRLTTTVKVVFQGAAARTFTLALTPADPEVFQNADGSAAALNQDGTVNSPSNPAKPGTIVTIFATGAGAPAGEDGSTTNPVLSDVAAHVIDGDYLADLSIGYAGAAPTLVSGVTQINFRLPATAHDAFKFRLAVGSYSMGNTPLDTTFEGPVFTSGPAYLYVSQ